MKKYLVAILVALALVGSGAGIWYATKPEADADDNKRGKGKGPLTVYAAEASIQSTPIVLDGIIGTVEPVQSVAVRAQVSGVLQRVYFNEGDRVKVGALLFQLDPESFQAAVDEASANHERDLARLAEAQAQEQRLAPLADKEYITRQEYDQAVAQAKVLAAAAAANRAKLKEAQVQLDRTRIYASISGRAGSLNIKPGNLVSANSSTPLVTINGTQPVLVAFAIPQQEFARVRDYQRAGTVRAEIRRERRTPVIAEGELSFVDNRVDPVTGTVKLKARVSNDNEAIWTGELVAVRLILAVQPDAVVIPEVAVQPGQQGPYVYVIVDGKAQIRNIEIARQVDANVVVAQGLVPGERVIAAIPKALKAGSEVRVAGEKTGAQDIALSGKKRPRDVSERAPE